MKTLLEKAVAGEISAEMKQVAEAEGLSSETIREAVVSGKAVVTANINRVCRTVGIGKGLRTKVNASIGTSSEMIDLKMEKEKALVAEGAGADTLMELSTGGDLDAIRKEILAVSSLPVGSVPLYQAAAEAIERYGSMVDMTDDLLFEIIEKQAADGIGFMAIHCGINRLTLSVLKNQGYRYGGLVSRGGAFLVAWMAHNNRENPLYEQFDRLLEILKRHDVLLSLGNGMRAGAIQDSTDRAQIQELVINAELADKARKFGVQAMLEGPGHIPIDEIEANVILEKRLSNEKPFYMLGPITTDIAPGYDHITAAIGAAIGAAHGCDFICYVTPSEHLGLPYPADVREGVMAARVAAHVGDMIKLKSRRQDYEMGAARRRLDWENQFAASLDPKRAREIRDARPASDSKTCTMCGQFCAVDIVNQEFGLDTPDCV